MTKNTVIFAIASLSQVFFSAFTLKGQPISSIHQFQAVNIDGQLINFKDFKGKKLLVVNTASKCGFTPQLKDLQELYETYKDRNFMIIGFPCNQFGEQDPGSNSEIKEFCSKNYGVTFMMMEKIDVKGPHISPIYKWLTNKAQNGVMDSEVKWNFQKYLIDENGFLVDYVPSYKKPNSKKIIAWLNKARQ